MILLMQRHSSLKRNIDYWERRRPRRHDLASEPPAVTMPARTPALPVIILFFLFVSMCLTSCQKPASPEKPIDLVPKLKACLPEYKKNSINKTDNILKIKNVMSDYQGTTLAIIIAASDKPFNFYFPIYVYSKGRWLINPDDVNGKDGDKGRAYLIDPNCKQYKLKDRGASKDIDKNGRLKLKPGQTYEINLTFTPLPSNTRAFLLMYGERVILFNPEAPHVVNAVRRVNDL